MEHTYKLAIVGYPGSTLLYKAAGAQVYAISDDIQAREVMETIALPKLTEGEEGEYAVVFVEDTIYYRFPKDLIERFAKRALPAVIPVPSSSSGKSGSNRLKALVEKAVGSDILG